MTIKKIVEVNEIHEIVHFTSNHGLVGTLETGLVLSRRKLPEVDHLAYIASPTSKSRQEAEQYFDKAEDWLDFVNLSISEINQHYFGFASSRWHVSGDRWWTILSFKPEILEHPGVYFTTTNNIYQHVKRSQGADGLRALFATRINRKDNWYALRHGRAPRLPTCQQAEVLYPHALSIEYLQKVYVMSDEDHDVVAGWLRYYGKSDIEVKIAPEKFLGVPN